MATIPRLSLPELVRREPEAIAGLRRGASEIGFFTIRDTQIDAARARGVIEAYRSFFLAPEAEKARCDMAGTGANRGWGRPGAEQVDPEANPDYKEVFDCGHAWPETGLAVYAPNLWPEGRAAFRAEVTGYYEAACAVAAEVLEVVSMVTGQDPARFAGAFDRPMALLRGNYYPPRPATAGDKDFGIAAHTDYGCLTLLATDGVPGLEVQLRDGSWEAVTTEPGEFVINFGEMLEIWTSGAIVATPHRVIGGAEERISVPLFFNPRHDVNVAPDGAEPIRAVEHLAKRFEETYMHLKSAS